MTQDECSLEQYMHKMSEVLRCPYTVQAARPARPWWLWPRGLAWCQVLMMWSLVKPSVYAELLSRIGDYLCTARGPGWLLQFNKCTDFPHERSPTRDPPYPLFHRRLELAMVTQDHAALMPIDLKQAETHALAVDSVSILR